MALPSSSRLEMCPTFHSSRRLIRHCMWVLVFEERWGLWSIRRGRTVAAFKAIGSIAEQVANAENRRESSVVKDFPALPCGILKRLVFQ